MITRKHLYNLVCDLSAENDALWRQIKEIQKEIKSLKKEPTKKKKINK